MQRDRNTFDDGVINKKHLTNGIISKWNLMLQLHEKRIKKWIKKIRPCVVMTVDSIGAWLLRLASKAINITFNLKVVLNQAFDQFLCY